MILEKRIMGLDYGSTTIGVAVSDIMGLTAQPVETIKINEVVNDFKIKRLKELILEHNVGTVVLGLPMNMDFSEGERVEKTKIFAETFQRKIKNVELVYQDERLTTMQAERVLLEADMSRGKRKKVIDKMAATIILQTYLNKMNL